MKIRRQDGGRGEKFDEHFDRPWLNYEITKIEKNREKRKRERGSIKFIKLKRKSSNRERGWKKMSYVSFTVISANYKKKKIGKIE